MSLRCGRLDVLRGLALVWMAVFHFCFDLKHFGLLTANFHQDPLWTLQRSAIVSLFLFCAGVGQALAVSQAQSWSRFWQRWARIAACAVLVSLGSWWMFPRTFITFGVLHGMALMLILTRAVGSRPMSLKALWGLGAACLALPQFMAGSFFDSRWTNWVGLVTHLPVTEDFVPLLPWWGVMLWGLAAGRWTLQHRPHWVRGGLQGAIPLLSGLAMLGRWSLSFYMIHQPILMGGLMVFLRLKSG